MEISKLASRLVAARTDDERRTILKAHPRLVNGRLAEKIKDICYEKWSSEPLIAQRAAAVLRLMARMTRSVEVTAISEWVGGISDITRSKFETAIERLDRAGKLFNRTGRSVNSAETDVAKLIALAFLGRYADADKAGRRALSVFKAANEQLAAGKIELNLSNVAARRERHREAERLALSALKRFRSLDETEWQTMAENDLANTYSEMNDFRRAETYFKMALDGATNAGMQFTQAEIEASIGNLELYRGRYGEALRMLELSRKKYEQMQMPHQTAIAELEIAEVYAELNLLNEAESILGPLTAALGKMRLRADEARARFDLARVLIAQEKFPAALREIKRVQKLYQDEGNVLGAARAKLQTAVIEIASRRFQAAVTSADNVIDVLSAKVSRRLLISARLLKGEALRRLGEHTASKVLLSRALAEANKHELPALALTALNSLGGLAMDTGDLRTARRSFEQARSIVEAMRAPLTADEFRVAFFAGQLEPYRKLLRLTLDEGDLDEAFMVHEGARSRALADMVDGQLAWVNAADARKIESLREELNWYYSRLSREEKADVPSIEHEIARRERELSKAGRRAAAVSSATKGRVRDRLELDRLLAALGSEKAFVEYVSIEDRISAFVITQEGVRFVDDLCSEDEIRHLVRGLRFQLETFRFGPQALTAFLPALKINADHYLEGLYAKLFAPVEPWFGDRDLVIAPAGLLNFVPFAGLYDGERYLIERHRVTLSPSASIWLSLRSPVIDTSSRALLMGLSDESIPLAESEVSSLARQFEDSLRFTGRRATFGAFLENAPLADVIHLACHGQFRSDNPMFSSLHLADGWVTADDIRKLDLRRAKLVTLSACETGLSEVQGGDEILGFTRGFLAAGAQNLIVSLWTVNDTATRRLMTLIYRSIKAGISPAEALQDAQKRFIREGSHPYFWSPFVFIGR